MLTPELWPKIAEAARLRIENKLIRDIERGEILLDGRTTGSLGTWGGRFMKSFSLREEAANVLITKLEDTDADDRHYVARFFMGRLPEILTDESEKRRAIRAISAAIHNSDANVRESIIAHVRQFPSVWQTEIAESLADVTDASNPAVVLDDGTPLLAAPTATEVTDQDIPF
jgi:hypothetical protein